MSSGHYVGYNTDPEILLMVPHPNENAHYVYAYLDPRRPGRYTFKTVTFLFEPFYIGKGFGRRYKTHLTSHSLKNHSHKNRKITKIITAGLEPIVVLLLSGIRNEEAITREIRLIQEIGRANVGHGPLTNLTDGGEGVCGLALSKEARAKISFKLKGRALSEETKAKMRGRATWNKGVKGTPAWNKGVAMRPETRAKLEHTFFAKGRPSPHKGVPMSAERYEKCKATMFQPGQTSLNKGKKMRPLTEKEIERRRNYRHTEEAKRKIAARRGWKHSEEAKAKIRATKARNRKATIIGVRG